MILVSENPVFIDFSPIPIGTEVSIIEAKYVKFNPCTFAEEVLECHEDHFRTGTLLAKRYEYRVLLSNDEVVKIFREAPREYFFRKKEILRQI